jgi:hypothetical protein
VVLASMNGMDRLVNSCSHLFQYLVQLDQVLLGSRIGQHMMLCQRAWANRMRQVMMVLRGMGRHRQRSVELVRRLRHVFGVDRPGGTAIGCAQRGTMQGQQGPANVGVRQGVDLPPLGASQEIINHIEGALSLVRARPRRSHVV